MLFMSQFKISKRKMVDLYERRTSQSYDEMGLYIGPFCLIGYPPEIKDLKNVNCGVRIMEGTKIMGSVTIDGGSVGKTYIGANCYIMKQVHIGHDAYLFENVTISPGARIGGHAIIGRNVTIGMNAVIHQRVEIPEGCMIGMGAIITKNCKLEPYRKYVGVGRDIGENTVAKQKYCV
jgi:UDP-N-acetylglucosamine acyltransferase